MLAFPRALAARHCEQLREIRPSRGATLEQANSATGEEEAVAVVAFELRAVVGGEEGEAHGEGRLASRKGAAGGTGLDENEGS